MMMYQKPKKINQGNPLPIKINVIGSAGPLRLIVKDEELVASVINIALKSYAREGRFPILGTDLDHFVLYCSNSEGPELNPEETIGSRGGRNFCLYRKSEEEMIIKKKNYSKGSIYSKKRMSLKKITRKGSSGHWRSWLNKKSHIFHISY